MGNFSKTLILSISLSAAWGCKPRGLQSGGSGVSSIVGSGCKLEVGESLEAEFAKLDDPIKKHVVNAANCVRSENRFKDLDQMLTAAGCKIQKGDGPGTLDFKAGGRAFVSEEGQFRNVNDGKQVLVRAIDVWRCPNDAKAGTQQNPMLDGAIFVTSFGPQTSEMELIAWDKANQQLVFYTQSGGSSGEADYALNGTSFKQATAQEVRGGFFGNHPCTKCHVNGGLQMKELRFPWMNWHSPIIPMKELNAMKKNMLVEVENRVPFIAEVMEQTSISSQIALNSTRVKMIKAKADFAQPANGKNLEPFKLKALLKPLFCQNEAILATASASASASAPSFTIPGDFFLNRLLLPLQKDGQPSINLTALQGKSPFSRSRLDPDGLADTEDFGRPAFTEGLTPVVAFSGPKVQAANWKNVFVKRGITVAASGQPTHPGTMPFLISARAFSDDDLLSQLVREGVLEEKLVVAGLMVDFPNPMFSSRRCQILDAIDDNASTEDAFNGGQISATKMTERIRNMIGQNKAKAGAGADEFIANIDKNNADHAQRVVAYLNSCNGAGNISKNLDQLYQVLRAKSQRLFEEGEKLAIEGFVEKIFPEDAKLEGGEFKNEREFGLNETCGFRN